MPLGYVLAPRTFSKCVEAALEPLHRQGIRLIAYLEDLMVVAMSAELAITHTTQTVIHLTRLRFAVNWEKSVPFPSHRIVYLGLLLDTDYEGSNFRSSAGCLVASPTKVLSE